MAQSVIQIGVVADNDTLEKAGNIMSIKDDGVTADKLDVVAVDGDTGKVNPINSTNFEDLDSSNLLGLSIVPIGSILAFHKSFTNTPSLPANFVECNGQTLSDGASVYDGQVIPDLNASSGTEKFLRGKTTSGGNGGSETHTHVVDKPGVEASGSGNTGYTGTTNAIAQGTSTLPSYFEVVWIMRIK